MRGTEGKIDCIQYARENNVPYLGLCLGFQMAVIEYARNVCGMPGANSTEFDPRLHAAGHRYPARAEEDRRPRRQHAAGRQRSRAETRARCCASCTTTPPASACVSAIATKSIPSTSPTLEEHGMIFSGKHPDAADHAGAGIAARTMHPYFVGTQAHPELTSRPLRPSPLFMGLVKAAADYAELREKTVKQEKQAV